MTQAPRGGQTAPSSTDLEPGSAAHRPAGRDGSAPGNGFGAGPSWGPPGYSGTPSGGPGSPDAPTGTLPQMPQQAAGAPSAPSGPPDGSTTARSRTSRSRGPRRARLQLRHLDPWTVLKFSCVLSIALFFVWLIVVGVLYGVLDAAGIIGKINDTVTTLQGGNASNPVTPSIVFGAAAIVGVIDIVLFIALSTIGSLVYNLCADLVGGVEITLSER